MRRFASLAVMLCIVFAAGCETDLTDVEERLDKVETRLDELETKCNDNATAIRTLQAAAENSVALSSYVATDEGWALTLSDGTRIDVLKASALKPQIKKGSELGGEYDPDTYYVSVDGTEWVELPGADQLITDVEVDEAANLFRITLLGGQSISIPYAKDMLFSFTGAEGTVYFERGETKQLDVTTSNVASTVIVAPNGWKAALKNNVMSITAPVLDNIHADESGDIQVVAVSKTGFSIVTKLPVSANVLATCEVGELVVSATEVLTTVTVSETAKKAAYAVLPAGSQIEAADLFDGSIEGAVVKEITDEYSFEALVENLTEKSSYLFVAAAQSLTDKFSELVSKPFTTEESGPILLGIESGSVNGCTLLFDREVASRGTGQIYTIYVDLYAPNYIYTPGDKKEWVEGTDFTQNCTFDGTRVEVTFAQPWAGNTLISYSLKEGAFVGANGKGSVECLSNPRVNGLTDWGFYYGYGWKNDVALLTDLKFTSTVSGTSFDTWRRFVAIAYLEGEAIDTYAYGTGAVKFVYDEEGQRSEVVATDYQVVNGQLRVKLPRRPARYANVSLLLEEGTVTAAYGNYNARIESAAWSYTGDASDPDTEITGVQEGVYTYTPAYDQIIDYDASQYPFDLHVKQNADGSYTLSNWFNLDKQECYYSDIKIENTYTTELPAYYDADKGKLIVGRSSKESTDYKLPHTVGTWNGMYVRLITINAYGKLVASKGVIEFNVENGRLIFSPTSLMLGAFTSPTSITGTTYKGALKGFTAGSGGTVVYKGELPAASQRSAAKRVRGGLLGGAEAQ